MFENIKIYDFIILNKNLLSNHAANFIQDKPYFIISINKKYIIAITSLGIKITIIKTYIKTIDICDFSSFSSRDKKQFKIVLKQEQIIANKLNYLLRD